MNESTGKLGAFDITKEAFAKGQIEIPIDEMGNTAELAGGQASMESVDNLHADKTLSELMREAHHAEKDADEAEQAAGDSKERTYRMKEPASSETPVQTSPSSGNGGVDDNIRATNAPTEEHGESEKSELGFWHLLSLIISVIALVISCVTLATVMGYHSNAQDDLSRHHSRSIDSLDSRFGERMPNGATIDEIIIESDAEQDSAAETSSTDPGKEQIESGAAADRWYEVMRAMDVSNADCLTADPGLYLNEESHLIETWYSHRIFKMNGIPGSDAWSIREDGVIVDADGYVVIAAPEQVGEKGDIVETSLGQGKVYDRMPYTIAAPDGTEEDDTGNIHAYIDILTEW